MDLSSRTRPVVAYTIATGQQDGWHIFDWVRPRPQPWLSVHLSFLVHIRQYLLYTALGFKASWVQIFGASLLLISKLWRRSYSASNSIALECSHRFLRIPTKLPLFFRGSLVSSGLRSEQCGLRLLSLSHHDGQSFHSSWQGISCGPYRD